MSKKEKLKIVPFHKAIVKQLNKCNDTERFETCVELMETSLPDSLLATEKGVLTKALNKAKKNLEKVYSSLCASETFLKDVPEFMKRGKAAINARA